jgi:hypothetical protein
VNRFGVILMLLSSSAVLCGQSNKTSDTPEKIHAAEQLEPSPEVKKLLQSFAGDWSVSENFEISATKQGRTRQGVCRIKAAPGFSMLEDCRTNGSAGELRFLAVLWWDPKADAYQFFTCANHDGCVVRGTARWQGDDLVNTWEEEDKGKKVAYRDSFVNITPSSFTLVSEGISDGTSVWRVTTKYVRQRSGKTNP